MEENIKKEESTNTQDTKQEELVDLQEHKQDTDKKSIKINKRTIIIIGIIIVLGVLFFLLRGLFVVATVDGNPISRLSIIKKLEKVSGQSLLDSIIIEKLIQNEAKSKKIVISDEEINTQIKTIEDQLIAQGTTLDVALTTQGMTRDELKEQIILQKQAEKLVGDKISITDEEVAQYIKDNNIEVPQGQEATINEQVKNALNSEKLSSETQKLISDLKSKAKIKYFVNY
jgi:foldase protein PrsA